MSSELMNSAFEMNIKSFFQRYGCLFEPPISPRFERFPFSLLTKQSLCTSVGRYCSLVEQCLPQIILERALDQVKSKVDSLCIQTVLKKPSIERDRALRFFIWAGQQSYYRHSSFMYTSASEYLQISCHPEILTNVLETYRGENLRVSVKAFKVILNICREAKLADYALKILRKMKEFNCRPDTVSYNIVIQLFCDENDIDMVEGLIKEMAMMDLYPDMITYMSAIKGLCNIRRLDDACRLFDQMRSKGCSPNKVVYSALVHGACLAGRLDVALEVLSVMEKEALNYGLNAVAYTSLIQSLCEKRQAIKAIGLLERMTLHGCAPNWVTARTLINNLIMEGHVNEAYKVVDKFVAECSSLSAEKCYSGLLVSLILVKNIDEAEKVVKMMLADGIKPTGAATRIVIKYLSTSGRSLDGLWWLYELVKHSLHMIDPELYSFFLVNVCQGGHFGEAKALIDEMASAGIPARDPYASVVVELLNTVGENNLANQLLTMKK